jgi:hypothetical protein
VINGNTMAVGQQCGLTCARCNGRAGGRDELMEAGLERNKANVCAFYDLMFNGCKPAEAIRRYAGEKYIQHNPHVADGKDAFID